MGEKRRLCGIWRRREGGGGEQRIRGIDGSNSGLNELTDRTTAPGNGRIGNGAGHGECAPRGRVLGWSLAPLTELLYDKGGLGSNKHDVPALPRQLSQPTPSPSRSKLCGSGGSTVKRR